MVTFLFYSHWNEFSKATSTQNQIELEKNTESDISHRLLVHFNGDRTAGNNVMWGGIPEES